MCSTRNRHLSSQFKDFWFSEQQHITLQQTVLQYTFAEIQTKQGAGRVASEHRSLGAGQRVAQAPLSPRTGTPLAHGETLVGCHPSHPGSLVNTEHAGVDTSTVVFHVGQLLSSFQSSSSSQETPKPTPAPSPRSCSTNRKLQGR